MTMYNIIMNYFFLQGEKKSTKNAMGAGGFTVPTARGFIN